MLNIEHPDRFKAVVSEAIEKVAITVKSDSSARRWIRSIEKAADLVEAQPEFITWLEDEKAVLIWNQETNQVYTANGVCQCKAFNQGQPCKHRSLARLVMNYLAV